jgi:hypothetical protein
MILCNDDDRKMPTLYYDAVVYTDIMANCEGTPGSTVALKATKRRQAAAFRKATR